MATQIIYACPNNEYVALLPDWQLSHIGITKDEQGNRKGHTSFKDATGSVFEPSFLGDVTQTGGEEKAIAKLTSYVQDAFNNPDTKKVGNLMELKTQELVGFDALSLDTKIQPDSLIIKSEYDPSIKGQRAVLVPSISIKTDADVESRKTNLLSIIAPPTSSPDYLPEDVKTNPKVLEAMQRGQLRTIVSMFPGQSIIPVKVENTEAIQFKDVPRASQMADSHFKFYTSDTNANKISLSSPEHAEAICRQFNAQTHVPYADLDAVRNLVDTLSKHEVLNECLGPIDLPDLTYIPTPPKAELVSDRTFSI